MKCLLFITFIAVSAIRSKVFDSAEHFVSSMNTIDPGKINPLIDMVKGMLKENAVLIEGLERGVVECGLTVDKSKAALLVAQQEKKEADQALATGAKEVSRLNQVAAEKLQAEKDASDASILAEANKNAKEINLASETTRIEAEDATLKNVRKMIADINNQGTSLNEMGRNLLSFDIKSLLDADPQSITELLRLIDGLIKAGQDDLQIAKDELTAASGEASAAKKTLEAAVEQRQIADGAALKQLEKMEGLREDVDTAKENVVEAQSVLEDDESILKGKADNLEEQKKLVEQEATEMAKIIGLLESVRD